MSALDKGVNLESGDAMASQLFPVSLLLVEQCPWTASLAKVDQSQGLTLLPQPHFLTEIPTYIFAHWYSLWSLLSDSSDFPSQ